MFYHPPTITFETKSLRPLSKNHHANGARDQPSPLHLGFFPEYKELQLVLASRLFAFTRRLGLGALGLLLAVAAGCKLLDRTGVLAGDSLLVDAFHVGMGRSYAGAAELALPATFRRGNLGALVVDDARLGLVLGLKFHLALELGDLLVLKRLPS